MHVGTRTVIADLADERVLIKQHARGRIDELQVPAGGRPVNKVLIEIEGPAESRLRAERATGGIETVIAVHPAVVCAAIVPYAVVLRIIDVVVVDVDRHSPQVAQLAKRTIRIPVGVDVYSVMPVRAI